MWSTALSPVANIQTLLIGKQRTIEPQASVAKEETEMYSPSDSQESQEQVQELGLKPRPFFPSWLTFHLPHGDAIAIATCYCLASNL